MADEYVGGARQRLVEAIDINELKEKRSCEFEVTKEDAVRLDGEAAEELEDDEELEAKRRFFKNISLKNIPVVSCSAQEALGDFDELEANWTRIADGVHKKVYQPGKGGVVPPNAKVWIHYLGYFENGDEPFDNTIEAKKPRAFRLGTGEVLPGLDIAVSTMELREVSKFLIQPELAFGPLGCPPRIPANVRVLFSIELLEFQVTSERVDIFEMTPEERTELPFEEVYGAADSLKKEAKIDFKNEEFQDAVTKYSRAAKMLEEYYVTADSAQEEKKNVLLYNLFLNLGICYLKLEKPKKSREACKRAIQLPISLKKHKAYYNLGRAQFQLGHIDEARKAVEEAQSIDSNDDIRKFLDQIIKLQDSERTQERNLARMMMKNCRV